MILSLFTPNFFLCLGNGEVATNTGTGNHLYKWDEAKMPYFWKGWQLLQKGSFVFPMALRVTGPCLFGDCLLRTDSRANLPRKYVWASGRWGAMAGGDKYRVSRIRELITIMKYYCHVSFWWSRHDGRWSDKHQNVCNANIGVTS